MIHAIHPCIELVVLNFYISKGGNSSKHRKHRKAIQHKINSLKIKPSCLIIVCGDFNCSIALIDTLNSVAWLSGLWQ